MSWQLRVGAVQMRATDDLKANLATVAELTAKAAAQGAQLVALPECFSFLGRGEGDKLAIAEVLGAGGPVMTTLRELAIEHRVYVLGGGTPEVVPGDPKRTYNTAVVVNPGGHLIASYRKIHLFDVDIPHPVDTSGSSRHAIGAAGDSPRAGLALGRTMLRESDATVPGDELVVVEIAGARVGLSICYDVRFPELYRALVKDKGAEVLVVPAAFTAHTGAAHWHLLLRARAIENQAWIVAPAQWGRHNEKRESYGHTLVVDPWGTLVDELPTGDGVLMATLHGDAVTQRRAQMPCLQHAVLWKPL
jgi:predicted amidohydrolase